MPDNSPRMSPPSSIRAQARIHARTPQALRAFWHQDPPPGDLPALLLLAAEVGSDGRVDEGFSELALVAIRYEDTFLALSIVKAGLHAFHHSKLSSDALAAPGEVLLCVQAIAYARQGRHGEAQTIIKGLPDLPADPNSRFSRGDACAELALLEPDPQKSADLLEEAHSIFTLSGERHRFRISAAATAVWLGNHKVALVLAKDVARQCREALVKDPSETWSSLNLAESMLISRRPEEAVAIYQSIHSTLTAPEFRNRLMQVRQRALRHCKELGMAPGPVRAVLSQTIVVFAGHMIDASTREFPRFPAGDAPVIKERIREALMKINPSHGISNAACGGDILFLECMQEMKCATTILMSWRREDFVQRCVAYPSEGDWLERFENVAKNATSVIPLSQQNDPGESGLTHEFLSECLAGTAMIFSDAFQADLAPMALWDGRDADGPGGSATFLTGWNARAKEHEGEARWHEVVEVKTNEYPRPASVSKPHSRPSHVSGTLDLAKGESCIRTMLFADVNGYSKLPESSLPAFVRHFFGGISELVANSDDRPVTMNTWGDAIYFVFDQALQGGRFALEMLRYIRSVDWEGKGLPDQLGLRMALHTGPVLMCMDPLVRHITFTGTHVSHAARAEPITARNQVWGTEAFAAYCRLSTEWKAGDAPFSLSYLGQGEFAKGYGCYPLFRVHENRPA